jgi:hypothetical protein
LTTADLRLFLNFLDFQIIVANQTPYYLEHFSLGYELSLVLVAA